jgi:dynein heavy chain
MLDCLPCSFTSISLIIKKKNCIFYRLKKEYEEIAQKALTTPANTEQLMELKEYIEKVESDIIFQLEKKLVESKDRLTFLFDHTTFQSADLKLNAGVFIWHQRMPAVFNEHKVIVAEKRSQYEDSLKVSSIICQI